MNLLKHLFQALSHIVQVLETDCFLIWDSKWRPKTSPIPPIQDQLRQWANNKNLFNNIHFFVGFVVLNLNEYKNNQTNTNITTILQYFLPRTVEM